MQVMLALMSTPNILAPSVPLRLCGELLGYGAR